MLKWYNPQILFLIETKLSKEIMRIIRNRYGFLNGIYITADGSRGGLCLGWKGDAKITLRSYLIYHVNVDVEESDRTII